MPTISSSNSKTSHPGIFYSLWRRLPKGIRDVVIFVVEHLGWRGKIAFLTKHRFKSATPDTPVAVVKCIEQAMQLDFGGDYYEFGMFRGYTFWTAQRAADRLGWATMRFFGFDSFAGLPTLEQCEAETGEFRKGDYACSRAEVEGYLKHFGVDWSRTHLIEGFFNESLQPVLKEKLEMRTAAVVLIDCDLYRSTVEVLSFVEKLLRDGSILLFDDWNCFNKSDERGERLAFGEFLDAHPEWEAVPFVSFGWHGQAFILRSRPGESIR